MEYNHPSEIVKDLAFGSDAKNKIMKGVKKLTDAVETTLGASGKCVIYEDAMGKPVITKDGVTVANSVVLLDPVENIGARLIKEAAQKTVKEAGDGTTTSTVLASAILNECLASNADLRTIKLNVENAKDKVLQYLEDIKIEVKDDMLDSVATISANNDKELGEIIAGAYKKVGSDGVVLMEESDTEKTYVEIVDGVQFDSGLKSQHLATDDDKVKSELDNPYILIVGSEIPNIRKIQAILEHVIREKRSLLIVAQLDQQPLSALIMNKVKGNIKVNVVDVPGFGATKHDTMEDLATITGAKIVSEELGDDLDLIQPDCLGEAVKSVTDDKNTVITIKKLPQAAKERIKTVRKKIKEEKNDYIKEKLQQRLAMLSGAVGIIKVGANSKVELKEKKDRVDDAIHATKAALREGIVPGAGIALHNAATNIESNVSTEKLLYEAIKMPYKTILLNAGINYGPNFDNGWGINVVTGKGVDLIKEGIIDPVLVTKTALINAVSVALTILSADCVISNIRINESSK
uniref:Chaperonin GroEL n=1 Tax=uncultured virus TaxID=340016 RepID=A0A240F751_9VIRU|nr:chaperonin GroEL [uncultured virus]